MTDETSIADYLYCPFCSSTDLKFYGLEGSDQKNWIRCDVCFALAPKEIWNFRNGCNYAGFVSHHILIETEDIEKADND